MDLSGSSQTMLCQPDSIALIVICWTHSDKGHHLAAFFQLGASFAGMGFNNASAVIASFTTALFVDGENGFQNIGDINLGTFAALGYGVATGQISTGNVGALIRGTLC